MDALDNDPEVINLNRVSEHLSQYVDDTEAAQEMGFDNIFDDHNDALDEFQDDDSGVCNSCFLVIILSRTTIMIIHYKQRYQII